MDKMFWHSYVADKGGCGHIRVIFPSLLCNTFKHKEKEIYASYNWNFIMDEHYYKEKAFTIFQRAATPLHLEFIKALHNKGKEIIYEIDDDFLDIPDWNMASAYYKAYRKTIIEMLKVVDGITVSTQHLKSKYSKYNKNISIIPNHLPEFLWGKPLKPIEIKDKPRILWAGSSNHFAINDKHNGGDFGKELLDFIIKTVDIYQWVFMGGFPHELDSVKDKIEFHKWQNIYQYPNYLKSLKCHLGVVSLYKHEFNKGKSDIKAKEFTHCGIPTVFSKFGPYKHLTTTGKSDQVLIGKIEQLLSDENKRIKSWQSDNNILKEELYWSDKNLLKYINTNLNLVKKESI